MILPHSILSTHMFIIMMGLSFISHEEAFYDQLVWDMQKNYRTRTGIYSLILKVDKLLEAEDKYFRRTFQVENVLDEGTIL